MSKAPWTPAFTAADLRQLAIEYARAGNTLYNQANAEPATGRPTPIYHSLMGRSQRQMYMHDACMTLANMLDREDEP